MIWCQEHLFGAQTRGLWTSGCCPNVESAHRLRRDQPVLVAYGGDIIVEAVAWIITEKPVVLRFALRAVD